MARSALLLASSLCLLLTANSGAQNTAPPPVVSGYITRVASTADFDVDGAHIRTGPGTQFGMHVPNDASREIHSSTSPLPLYLGLSVDIYGKPDRKSHSVLAGTVVLHHPAAASVGGVGIIDLIPPNASAGISGDRIVRADGYLLRITPKTSLTFNAPLTSSDPLTTNLWITYHGLQQIDGTVLVSKASVRKNTVNDTEDWLRSHDDYDPAAVDPDAHQNPLRHALLGTDIRNIPPFDDPAQQERVRRIGATLIPAYQKNLALDDPTRINFRF